MRGTMYAGLVLASVMLAASAGTGVAADQPTREALEQQLQEQQAKNQALKQRIEKIEALLKTDVCANPAAAEAVLKEAQATGAAPSK